MGLGSRGFLPLTRKLPQIVVQRGSPHDLSRSVQNEQEFVGFCLVPRHRTKSSFLVPRANVMIQSSAPHDLTRIRQNELDSTRFLPGSRTPFKI